MSANIRSVSARTKLSTFTCVATRTPCRIEVFGVRAASGIWPPPAPRDWPGAAHVCDRPASQLKRSSPGTVYCHPRALGIVSGPAPRDRGHPFQGVSWNDGNEIVRSVNCLPVSPLRQGGGPNWRCPGQLGDPPRPPPDLGTVTLVTRGWCVGSAVGARVQGQLRVGILSEVGRQRGCFPGAC
jgi:hypothetical protein